MRKRRSYRKRLITMGILLAMLLILMIVFFVLPFLPLTENKKKQCLAEVEYDRCYTLLINGKSRLYINDLGLGDVQTVVTADIDSVRWLHTTLKGVWINKYLFLPFNDGRLVVANPDYQMDEKLAVYNQRIDTLIKQNIDRLEKSLTHMKKVERDVNYYLDVNNVTDIGYNSIATIASKIIETRQQREHTLALLKSITTQQQVEIKIIQRYTLIERDDSGHVQRTACRILENEMPSDYYTIETEDRHKSKGAHSIYHNITTADFVKETIKTAPLKMSSKVYEGEMSDGKREGHGMYYDDDGNFYDGFWKDDKREGFGFAIDTIGRLRAGEWKADVFQGERMTYTADRIYGIDISRYQHDIGKKKYAINWDKVRISHLGTISSKKIRGDVDYPISFCYIKSTEGKTIKNNYYNADYTKAKKVGIRCGAYHFFSTKSNASEQARWFLQNTHFQKGDLPPVLDVEPSGSQIRAMGGSEAMWNAIRTWLTTVEKTVGVKPLLYVSQNFVNRYMEDAPDIKRDYRVWIARYGEYKPDIKLAIWQLCPDGRVSGIHGHVDINVFNGYNDQYEDFLQENCIR